MKDIDLNNPMDVRRAGIKALKDALGPVGMVKFMQQFESGQGNYTKEKYEEPDMTLDEMHALRNN